MVETATVRPKVASIQAKFGNQLKQHTSNVAAKASASASATADQPSMQQKHHLNSWSLAKGPPVPSIENYIVNIDGSVKGMVTLDSQ